MAIFWPIESYSLEDGMEVIHDTKLNNVASLNMYYMYIKLSHYACSGTHTF